VPVPTRRFDGFVSTRNLRLGFAELLAAAYVGRDPASFTEAMRSEDSDQWSEACQYEMDALAKNGTWELVDLLPSHRAVKSKWVFKLKADGRYCAQLVAKGFMQIPGLDFDETFSPSLASNHCDCFWRWPRWRTGTSIRWMSSLRS